MTPGTLFVLVIGPNQKSLSSAHEEDFYVSFTELYSFQVLAYLKNCRCLLEYKTEKGKILQMNLGAGE